MAAQKRQHNGSTGPSGGIGPGRRGLVPENPLPIWKAFVQVLILLGIPIGLLLVARTILRVYFPELGY